MRYTNFQFIHDAQEFSHYFSQERSGNYWEPLKAKQTGKITGWPLQGFSDMMYHVVLLYNQDHFGNINEDPRTILYAG